MAQLVIKTKDFSQLTPDELYAILQLRSEVFVVEQNCVYQDIDGKDQEAVHILGFRGKYLIGYTRCFAPGLYFEEASIGRVLVKQKARGKGYAHELMKASIACIKSRFDTDLIKISAQQYLIPFYNAHGFNAVGEGYLEDNIPHIAMLYDASA